MLRVITRFIAGFLLVASVIGCASTDKSDRGSTPVFSSPLAGTVNSGFALRVDFSNGKRRIHHGIDIGGQTGAPVRASASGRVTAVEWQRGYGNIVIIDHGGGWQTRYAHLSAFTAQRGTRVEKGETIGLVGKSGNATGPHLHFEIRKDGQPLNPASFLR